MTLLKLASASAAALLFAACTPPATQQSDAPEPQTEAAQSSANDGDGVVRVSFNGGDEVEMAASECVMVNDGANGVVRAGDGSFELSWSDDTGSRVVWDTGSGIYNGPVHGALQGETIMFQGDAAGMTVNGSATCG